MFTHEQIQSMKDSYLKSRVEKANLERLQKANNTWIEPEKDPIKEAEKKRIRASYDKMMKEQGKLNILEIADELCSEDPKKWSNRHYELSDIYK